MSIDKSTKSSSNPNPSIRIENKAGGGESREAPLMIASGNVYLRLGFLFMLGLQGRNRNYLRKGRSFRSKG